MPVPEPKRDASIPSLTPEMQEKVWALLKAMWARGFDAKVFEARRSEGRQEWLYGIGRMHHKNRKPVTWTLYSRHLDGKAADIISKAHGWSDPGFFKALGEEAHKLGLKTIPQEQCHVQLP